MNTKQNLLACADYLEENGWHQGDALGPDGGSMCSVAVMDHVARQTDRWSTAYVGMRDALTSHLSISPYGEVARWNDAPERTKEEVVAAFRAAAGAVTP